MVARQSPSDSADVSNVEALRDALAEREAEVEGLRLQIAELASARGDFVSEAAHAIRSPLTLTQSYLEILYSDLLDGLTEEQKSFIGIALENSVKLRKLIDDLVDLAAFETGIAQIELAPVSVEEIIASIHNEFRPITEHKGLRSSIDVSKGLPTVTADQDRLRDVLRRLLDNAIRFTPEDGSVTLRAIHDQRRVAIEVVDSGVGIPTDRISDSFRAFVQLHRKPGESREHFGLGLPLCRRMVEAFGGTIELASVEGEGTTATIRLPISGDEV
jgi:signal transduction histidine kinase